MSVFKSISENLEPDPLLEDRLREEYLEFKWICNHLSNIIKQNPNNEELGRKIREKYGNNS